ncbi:MAG TPA: GntR family transcriptional regulator [Propionibacteriaceae bacterium]|nr:GntR family transcriptional regulator [Propionibacteriaceae bacterium]
MVSTADPEHSGDETAEETLVGYDLVMAHLTEGILDRVYVAGSQLPTERQLAADLGVSRSAVREAIKVLQAQGIITTGAGRAHGTRISTTPSSAFGRMLRLHLALGSTDFGELTDTRVVLERAAVAAAALRATPEALEIARTLAWRMTLTTGSEEFNQLDTDFHVALAEVGENRLIGDFTVAIRQAVAPIIRVAQSTVADWEALRRRLATEHLGILEAVEGGRADEAADLTERHIRGAHEALSIGSA